MQEQALVRKRPAESEVQFQGDKGKYTGLAVSEIADHLDRTLRGTETLLVRARAALRRVYQEEAA